MPHPPLPPAWRAVLLVIDPLSAAAAVALAPLLLGHPPTQTPLAATLAATLALLARSDVSGAVLRRNLLAVGAAAGLAVLLAGSLDGRQLALSAGLAVLPPALLGAIALLATTRRGPRRALLVGPLDCRCRVREHLAAHPEAGLAVVAEVGPGADPLATAPVFALGDLERVVAEFRADEVLLSTGFDDRLLLVEVMARLLERPLTVRYVPDPEALPLFCPRPADLAGMPAIDLTRSPLSPTAETLKWLEDKTVALAALAVIALPMLLIAAAIKLTSPGPVFFVQERHGRYGRLIRVRKFRTMRSDAAGDEVTTGSFRQAAKGDPRITPLGRFLRNTSLDELPQFLNVLFGDMSVVGPRPHVPALNRRYAGEIGEMMRRHYVKPGITGLAQISGARGETRTTEDMRRRVNYDLEYLRRWSLWLDLKIIAYTVLFGWLNRHP